MKKLKSFLEIIASCLSLSWKSSKAYTIIRVITGFIPSLLTLISAYFVKLILDLLTIGTQDLLIAEKLIFLIIATSFLSITSLIARKLTEYSSNLHNDIIQNQIALMILDKGISADLEIYDNPELYDKLEAMRNDSYSVNMILWNTIQCISSAFSLISTFIIMSSYNLIYALCIVIAAIPSALVNHKYTKIYYDNELNQLNNERQKGYIGALASYQEYAQEIRYLNLGSHLKSKYVGLWDMIFCSKKSIMKKRTVLTSMVSTLPEICIAIITINIIFQIISSSLTIGDYSFYNSLLIQISAGVLLFIDNIISVYENKLKIENFNSFEKLFANKIVSGNKAISQIDTIEFRDVSFSYPDTEKKVLDGINFAVAKGEKIALVGVNGAGKSTIVKLLLRLYDVTSGEILINGNNIKEYQLVDLHKCYSVYFQNSFNYCFSLRENISLQDESDVNMDKKIIEALHGCAADDIFRQCHENLDTYLTRAFTEDGAELSIGQHQKVALARAVFRNASCYVLDEPSSSLDPEAEHIVFETLADICKDKTTIFTSHRLSNIHLADRIIVIENGKVIESGTQEELLANPNRYAMLYKYQADRFQEKTGETVC